MDSVAFDFTILMLHKICIFRERELAESTVAQVVFCDVVIYLPLALIC